MIDERKVKTRLVEHGRKLFEAPKEQIRFTKNDEADRLLNDLAEHPHAFVLACIMDRQIKAEKAWLIPYRFKEKLGNFSMGVLANLSEADMHRIMTDPEPLHRYTKYLGQGIILSLCLLTTLHRPCKLRIMPRSLRIEYPGAVYHVLNRGNYRHAIFASDASKRTFEETLTQACERTGWIIHAFTLLDNHYHICLETPDANLSVGMQWLQSSFANYFNRSVRDQGHVFQGRYKSLVVERDAYLGPLVNYIHLNPLRAGLEDTESLGQWRWSSLWYLLHKRKRWPNLDLSPCLYSMPVGWRTHRQDAKTTVSIWLGLRPLTKRKRNRPSLACAAVGLWAPVNSRRI